MTVRFHKLHATGNDFLVLVDLDGRWGDRGAGFDPEIVVALCDRHSGVGADGVLRLFPAPPGCDVAMELTNADGGRAEMTGNGSRCVAWAAARSGVFTGDRLRIDTAAGPRTVDVERNAAGDVVSAAVDMGPASFDPAAIPVAAPSPFDLEVRVGDAVMRGDAAGMGNPHFVIVTADVDAIDLATVGPQIECDPRFPRRTNVEFVAVRGDGLRMRVWERGVGITQSCGTGACAAAAVAHRRGLVPARTTVEVDGGRLDVEVGETIRLAGPVVHVFDVDIDIDRLLARGDAGTKVRA